MMREVATLRTPLCRAEKGYEDHIKESKAEQTKDGGNRGCGAQVRGSKEYSLEVELDVTSR